MLCLLELSLQLFDVLIPLVYFLLQTFHLPSLLPLLLCLFECCLNLLILLQEHVHDLKSEGVSMNGITVHPQFYDTTWEVAAKGSPYCNFFTPNIKSGLDFHSWRGKVRDTLWGNCKFVLNLARGTTANARAPHPLMWVLWVIWSLSSNKPHRKLNLSKF